MPGTGVLSMVKRGFALILVTGIAASPAAAGTMDPPGGPDATTSRMKTLQQIHEKITTGAAVTGDRARPFTDVDFSATGSMQDLNTIFNELPASRTDGAVVGEVCAPATFWGLKTGTWGGQDASTLYRTGTRDCDPPVWNANPANKSIAENGSSVFTLDLTDRQQTDASHLTLLATSSSASLLPVSAIEFKWGTPTAAKWNVTLTPVPHQSGSSSVVITAVDDQGNLSAAPAFTLTVTAANLVPTITPASLPDQTTNEDVPTSVIPFTVADDHTAAGSLTVSATSSDTAVVPSDASHLVLTHSGANCTLAVTPGLHASGSTDVTVTVTDAGGQSATTTFHLTVSHVNHVPTATNVDRTSPKLTNSTAYELVVRSATPQTGKAVFDDVDASDTLTLKVIPPTGGFAGAAVVSGSGASLKITYTAPAATGSEIFWYAVCDNSNACAVGQVSVAY